MSSHNGQSAFITPKVQRVEDADIWQHARPRGPIDRPIHPALPLTDEQIQRNDDFSSHGAARRSAERRGQVPVFTPEQINAAAIAAAQRPQQAASDQASIAFMGHVQRLADLVDDQKVVIDSQAAAIADLQRRLGDLDGNAFVGESE